MLARLLPDSPDYKDLAVFRAVALLSIYHSQAHAVLDSIDGLGTREYGHLIDALIENNAHDAAVRVLDHSVRKHLRDPEWQAWRKKVVPRVNDAYRKAREEQQEESDRLDRGFPPPWPPEREGRTGKRT